MQKGLAPVKPGTDSPQETVLRLESDAYGLPEAHVNYEIIDHIRGSGTMKVDIAYPDDRVCIEYDGNYHYTHGRWMYDLDKRNRLRDLDSRLCRHPRAFGIQTEAERTVRHGRPSDSQSPLRLGLVP